MKVKGFLSGYEVELYSVLRIVSGFLFLWHGSQKLLHIPPMEGMLPQYAIYIGGPIELIGGFLVMIGLWSRWAAFIASGEMAFAYWIAHGTNLLLPLLNGGELAIIYCFLFLFISARGSELFSVDHLLKMRRLK